MKEKKTKTPTNQQQQIRLRFKISEDVRGEVFIRLRSSGLFFVSFIGFASLS